MPKAAGTSLVYTIGKILDIPVCSGTKDDKNNIECQGFYEVQKYHSIMGIRSNTFFNNVTKSKFDIYREHILPTGKHIGYLKKINRKIIVLLREPKDAANCYARMKGSKKMNIQKIQDELATFQLRYEKLALGNPKVMIIYYEDLVKNYTYTMKRIFKFWDLKFPNKLIPLKRIHYTGVGRKRLMKGNK
jgi:hypothetical protein